MYAAPTALPDRLQALVAAVLRELRAIALESREPTANALVLKTLNVPPARIVDGMVVKADGVNWNPGAGAGYYGYHSGAWNKLG